MARRGFLNSLGLALVMVLLFGMLPGALAEPRYPEKTDLAVSDNANILSREIVDDLEAFRRILENAIGVRLWVVTVNFLDGESVDGYGKKVFDRWQLSDNDLLLLMSSGDEEAVTVAGSSLRSLFSADSQQHLLNPYFLPAFQSEQYEEAFSKYIPALADFLGKKYGAKISTAALFGAPATSPTPAPTVQPAADNSWIKRIPGGEEIINAVLNGLPAGNQPEKKETRVEKRSGFSIGSLLLLLLLFSLIFGSRRRRITDRAGCLGCGCGPLGWLVAGLGLNELFQNRRRW